MRSIRKLASIVMSAASASLGIALSLGLFQPVAAGVITFDDVSGNGNAVITSITSGGYTFTSSHFHVTNDPGACSFGGCVSNGTNYASEDAPTLAGPVTMMLAAGYPVFSLVSFDGAELWLDDQAASNGFQNATTIRVEGLTLASGVVVADFTLDGLKDGADGSPDFQNFTFVGPGWNELTAVRWYGLDASGVLSSMAFDNINVIDRQVSQTPEPGTIALLGLGIAGLAAARRRRQ